MFTLVKEDIQDIIDKKFCSMGSNQLNSDRFMIGKAPDLKSALYYKQMTESYCYGDCKIENCIR